MPEVTQSSILEHFGKLKDPRLNRKKLYPLEEVLLVVLCGVICGAESWRDFVLFGKEKLDFLKELLPFANGIPSKNTYARVFAVIDSREFKDCFLSWVKSFQEKIGRVVSIDGKTLRRSFDNAKGNAAIHMVSAFASEVRLVLGQEKVDDKSNEITAIPELLKLLNLAGATVTIDAMGCQTEIAKKIIEKGADYILALKENQKGLHDDVKLYLDNISEQKLKRVKYDYAEETDKGHGRIEKRRCWITENIDWIEGKEKWGGLKSIGIVEAERCIGDKITVEKRYYISSLPAVAKEFGAIVRHHWCIENVLHWTLDVVFREDDSRIRDRCAAENMAIIRHTALNLLQKTKVNYKDTSLKALRKKAGWGNETLRDILRQKF